MSSNSSLTFERPVGIGRTEIKTALIAWSAYFVAVCTYCITYQALVYSVRPDVQGTIVTAIREWGVWVVMTPFAFAVLSKLEGVQDRKRVAYARLGVIVLLCSVACPVLVDLFTDTRGLAASLAIFLPRYTAVSIVVYLIWYVFLRRVPPVATAAPPATEASENEHSTYPENLLVSKGSDECLIPVERVESVSAAGNYVEIYARNQLYLMRATLKQLEELLPPRGFIRIHRSHIVKCDEIDRIKTQPSGNGTVQLRSGRVLSMSKKYKSELQKYRVH